MRKNIFVISNKGGVGKTTIAVNLAFLLSEKYKVGLLDADVHGPNIPRMLGLEIEKLKISNNKINPLKMNDNLYVLSIEFLTEKPLQPIPWRGPLKTKLINQFISDVNWPELDFFIVDLPPGTGDETLTIIQALRDNAGAIIVSTPQETSLIDAARAVNMMKEFKVPIIGIIENMAGPIFGEGRVEKFATDNKIRFLGKISLDKAVTDSSNEGKPFVLNKGINPTRQLQEICETITKTR